MSGFWSDFGNSILDASGANKTSASDNSAGQTAGAAFFTLTKEWLKTGKPKQALTDAIANSKQGIAYRQQATADKINQIIRDPKTWIIGLVVVLVVGGIGYSWGRK